MVCLGLFWFGGGLFDCRDFDLFVLLFYVGGGFVWCLLVVLFACLGVLFIYLTNSGSMKC